jgi:hypothetical protein
MNPSPEPFASLFNLKEERALTALCNQSGTFDGFRLRAHRRAKLLATYLIEENGELNKEKLVELIALFEKSGSAIYLEELSDGVLFSHQLHFLKKLHADTALTRALKRFHRPLCHSFAQQLIRLSLGLSLTEPLLDMHIRRAALAAALTPLRQNVGSCFATAPAILIQSEQVENLFADLYQLLTTGKLKRVFGGIEFMVPLSPSTGCGDLKRAIDFSHGAQMALGPGVIDVFVFGGLIPSQLDPAKKVELAASLLEPFVAKRAHITFESLIRQLLPEKEKEAREIFKASCDNALLKAWEFTLASFSEVKMEFSRWNLYSSLGLHPEEKNGIGATLHHYISGKLEEENQKVQKLQGDYEIAFEQVRGTESLLKNASSEAEIRRLRAEHQARLYHMQACLEQRDITHADAERYALFLDFLIKQYDLRFPHYFQEIYDAEMQEFKGGLYDDAPAGFRLVYKHGRSDAAVWSMISSAQEYVDALIDFFRMIESEISSACEWEKGKNELPTITSILIQHLRSTEFINSSLVRAIKAHHLATNKNQLVEIAPHDKKPWVYSSGGSLANLIKVYFRREGSVTEESKWVESPAQLLIFILDTLKALPAMVEKSLLSQPKKALLMTSPTHAFLLHPGSRSLREGWQDRGFTYTWVRDHLILPSEQFWAKCHLSPEQQRFLASLFFKQYPLLKSDLALSRSSLSVRHFRESVVKELSGKMRLSSHDSSELAALFDGFLFEMLPLTENGALQEELNRLVGPLPERIFDTLPRLTSAFVTAKELKENAKALFLTTKSLSPSTDIHEWVAQKARASGLAPPSLNAFADSNWSQYYFSFALNPGTHLLELWRTDLTGSKGMPMSVWKPYLDGTSRAPWSIYTRPAEYTMHATSPFYN